MKILHYLFGLPPVRDGGLVKYALDLAEGEAYLGNEVSILVPGKFTISRRNQSRIVRKKWKDIPCYHILNPLPIAAQRKVENVDLLTHNGNQEVYLRFLQQICPDIIHIHSFMGLHAAFLQAAKQLSIPVIYTTHDYTILCPAITLLKGKTDCQEKNWDRCVDCMGKPVSKRVFYLEQSGIYRHLKQNPLIRWLEYAPILVPAKIHIRNIIKIYGKRTESAPKKSGQSPKKVSYEKLHQYYNEMFRYIDYFHFNSRQARQVYEAYWGKLDGEIIHISNHNIKDRRMLREYSGTLQIGYIGFGGYYKGFPVLKEALDELYAEGFHDFTCHIYFNPKGDIPSYLIKHPPYREDRMEQTYRNMDMLILPSVWRETFGMVVLEALSFGVPVIVSDRVGAGELWAGHSGMGIITEPDKEHLKAVIKKIYDDRSILEEMNRQICKWETDLSFEKHVRDMLGFMKRAAKLQSVSSAEEGA